MGAIEPGASQYAFSDPRKGARREIVVHTYRPAAFRADSPIVLVIHGRKRNVGRIKAWKHRSSPGGVK